MALDFQNYATLVKTQAAAVSRSCQQAIDLSVGSVMRALLEANASVALWIQWLIGEVLAATRAATSTGSVLDSWMADFGLLRFPAAAAAGSVTFSRRNAGTSGLVMPGALVRTGLGVADQTFAVTADPTQPTWHETGYYFAASDLQITCPVVAVTTGVSGNVVAGSITMLASAIPGIDSVSNALPMVGGADAESDVALRSRFAGFLDGRNRATSQAVAAVIAAIKQGVSSTVADRVDPSGAIRPGHFTVTVDDGTGSPSAEFLSKVATAVDSVRPIGGTFSIRPPLVIPLAVQVQVTGTTTAQSAVKAAITAYMAALPIGSILTLTRLYQIAYGADRGVSNAFGALIDGQAQDYAPPIYGLIRPSSVTITQ